jgi:hypothetical protein
LIFIANLSIPIFHRLVRAVMACRQGERAKQSKRSNKKEDAKSMITLTFCECAENHKGMQKIGKALKQGFSNEDIGRLYDAFEKRGGKPILHRLHYHYPDYTELLKEVPRRSMREGVLPDQAYLLVLKNGIDVLTNVKGFHETLFEEQQKLDWDRKALMYGEVRNKNARHNLCYAKEWEQEPDYAKGKGRVVDLTQLPLTYELHKVIEAFTGLDDLKVEGNHYYDLKNCGIGYHGDAERKIVIGARLGASQPLYYQWFYWSKAMGEEICIDLEAGDLYIMSAKAVGTDWRMKKIPTLRHAAGGKRYRKINRV